MLTITSKDNSKIKLARKILAGDDDEFILLEGLRLAEEALRSEVEIVDALFTARFHASERGAALLAGITEKIGEDDRGRAEEVLCEIDEKVFDSITDTKTSQGVVLICRRPSAGFAEFSAHSRLENRADDSLLFIALHQITNPSNLGAILRTAEAAGVDGIIITKDSTDVFSAKALRGGMGANLRMPLWTGATFSEVAEWAKSKGCVLTAADAHAKRSYIETDWTASRILVFGSEAHGLSDEDMALIEDKITIPMENDVESLNLGVSCGIILFEARRQRTA